jgi:myosin-5
MINLQFIYRFARKSYKAKRELIIHVQSCIRRNIARKQLFALRTEARSVSHFKEVSYALENKVVELTQALTAMRDEKRSVTDRSVQLEAQIKNWVDKYEKMERRAKNLDERLQEPTVPQEQHDTLQTEFNTLTSEHRVATEKIKAQERELTQLKNQLETERTETATLRKNLEEADERAKNATDEAEVTEIRSQLAALKVQLSQALNAPRRQGSNNALRAMSPNPGMRNPSPSPNRNLDPEAVARHRSRSPAVAAAQVSAVTLPATTASRRPRRNSSADMASNSRLKNSIENIRQAENLSKNPRPTSVDHFGALLGSKASGGLAGAIDESPEDEIHTLLRSEDALQEEILQGLIKSVKMPLPILQNPPSQKEILFPAHTISICVNAMWELGYIQESERLLFNVMDTIQKQFLSFTDEDAVVPCTFWLTNVHELLSLICIAHAEIDQELYQDKRKSAGRQDFSKLMDTLKFEMQCLEDNIFHAWMKEIKKHLSKMVIPAVVEGQSLPGFITSDNGRFFNKLLIGSSQPSYSMDDLLHFLNKVWRTMKCYYIEQTVATQTLTELLKLIGVSAFNDLLMRKNFCSWKRGRL